MALDYEEARQQAVAHIDAFNRHDLDAYEAGLHDEFTQQSPFADRHLGHEGDSVGGSKQAHREFLRWLWAQEPPLRHVFDEVFIGPHGYGFLTHHEHDGTQVFWAREVDAAGLVRSQRLYMARPVRGWP
jgi:hypothetical protein